jgi:hypothetical protein
MRALWRVIVDSSVTHMTELNALRNLSKLQLMTSHSDASSNSYTRVTSHAAYDYQHSPDLARLMPCFNAQEARIVTLEDRWLRIPIYEC